MNLKAVAAGTRIFLDANVFVYHFMPHPIFGPPCSEFLERIENGEVTGFTSALVLSELAHRLMTLEAIDRFNWPASGLAHRLKRHPNEVQQLSRYRQAIDEVSIIGIQILAVDGGQVSHAADFSRQFGLLTNDALIVAAMRNNGLDHIASGDSDFDRVPAMTRYSPV
jgi:predicted nucleic acid-binding protein